MRFLARWPFLTLAALTLIIGVVWHATADGSRSGILFTLVSVIGAPFIAAMRLASGTVPPPFTPLAGLLLGLAPYVAADFLLRTVRARRRRNA